MLEHLHHAGAASASSLHSPHRTKGSVLSYSVNSRQRHAQSVAQLHRHNISSPQDVVESVRPCPAHERLHCDEATIAPPLYGLSTLPCAMGSSVAWSGHLHRPRTLEATQLSRNSLSKLRGATGSRVAYSEH